VNANPHPQVFQFGLIGTCKRELHGSRTTERIHSQLEAPQHAIARRIDFAPVVSRAARAQQAPVRFEKCGVIRAQTLNPTSAAFYIGEQ
jgi:hypothetical protein